MPSHIVRNVRARPTASPRSSSRRVTIPYPAPILRVISFLFIPVSHLTTYFLSSHAAASMSQLSPCPCPPTFALLIRANSRLQPDQRRRQKRERDAVQIGGAVGSDSMKRDGKQQATEKETAVEEGDARLVGSWNGSVIQ
ncbi:hypothetical protein B0H13DRAFT_2365857 [Mycena leptocephala]|nr:hypothetical protein B0H13DRAFT_2365857 [Mycena leptocephala]